MEAMVYVHLVVAVLMLLAVLTTYFPVRRDPLTGAAFLTGWLVSELALQYFIVYSALVVLFEAIHAGRGLAGHVASVIDLVVLLGLGGLFGIALRARGVVQRDLGSTPGMPLEVAEIAGPPVWGSWWRTLLAWPMPGRRLEVLKDVAYADDGDRSHRLDVIRPRRAVSGAPVLVYIHGGAWVLGDKREQGRPMMYELASRGWICVTVNYRLSPKATWPDHIVDVLSSISWVKEHIADFGGDPDFIALSGGSAGGHLSALAALAAGDPAYQPGFEDKDTSVRACVPIYGVHDMTASKDVGGRHGPVLRLLLEHQVMKAPMHQDPDLYRRASPIHRVHGGAPPFLIMHGTHDTLVPVVVARTFVHVFRGVATAPVAYIELPFAQHGFDVLCSPRCTATTLGVVAFLETVRAEWTLEALWRRAILEVEPGDEAGALVHPAVISKREGRAVHLITGWNPRGSERPAEENEAANEALAAELGRRAHKWLAATGRDEASTWVEPGFCVLDLDREEAAELGRAFGQLAIYEIDGSEVSVVWCDSGRVVQLSSS
jgi:acetyl esterase/lipase